ncbi:MAG: choloylglycine hydrolase [Acutalibacteraceae bacterium]|nr:choloylglycine hydrolase [Acutalibacteraceae bacterium]
MCTAISLNKDKHLFGRTLDWFCSFGEGIIVTPKNYVFHFCECGDMSKHYAIIGMGIERGGYPLYFDAFNEKGLSVAGLNFPDNTVYQENKQNLKNIASYEFIPWVLGQCRDVNEVAKLIKKTNITNAQFNKEFAPTPLHWLISDKTASISVECVKDGVKIYDNEFGVLCNNPPFEYHRENIKRYMSLSPNQPQNNFTVNISLKPNSFGMGAVGLPGDFSSVSRFVRASFIKENTDFSEDNAINQFFKILSTVSVVKGAVRNDGKNEYTIYSSCHDTENEIYYCNKYESNIINAVALKKCDLNCSKIMVFPIENNVKFKFLN